MKKVLCMMLTIVLASTILTACTNRDQSSVGGNDGGASGKLFESPVTLSFLSASNTTFPTEPDSYIVKLIEQHTNVKIDWTLIPDPNYQERANLALASGDMPDLMQGNNAFAGRYGLAGAFINILDHLDKAPNFEKYYNSEKEQPVLRNFRASDGGLYGFPSLSYEGNNRHLWFYRKDIFDLHNLTAPEDFDELYEVSKALKEIYPDISPLMFNRFLLDANDYWNEMRHVSIAWGTGFPYHFDEDAGEWTLGLDEPGMKPLIMWFNKMYAEGLIPQDVFTMTQDQYRELNSSGKGFITMYYSEDLDRYNKIFESQNESAYFEWMKPPKGMVNGQHATFSMAFDNYNFCISSKSSKIDEAVKYVDWFYSDFAKELVTWGVEGESYEVVDGQKQFIIPEGREADGERKIYGIRSYGTYRVMDIVGMRLANGEKRWAEGFLAQAEYEHPLPHLPVYNEEEQPVWDNVGATVNQRVVEEVAKFILGTRDFSEWDQFVQEIRDLGADEVIRIRNAAYQRISN